MANEFKVKNGLIVIGDLTTSGTITINGALAATQSWVTSQAYLTSASLSGYATQSYVTSALAALVDAAPAALDTLNELAAALGDDANFSTTITNSIASKQAQLNGTGLVRMSGTSVSYDNTTYLISNFGNIEGEHGYGYPSSDGWYKIAEIALTSSCQSFNLWGEYRDTGYFDNSHYRIHITARAECDFPTNNESHAINVNMYGSSTNETYFNNNVRVVLTSSSSNYRKYELQYYRATWDTGSWNLQTLGWTTYTTSQTAGTPTGTARVYYISKFVADNIYAANKISIGTTYSGFAANIAGTTYVIGASVWVNDGYGITNASSGGTGFFPYSDGTLTFNSANSEKMRVASSGNVGIGTNSPGYKLEVNGGATGNNIARFTTGGAGGGTRGLIMYSDSSQLKLQVSDNAGGVGTWAFLNLNPDGGNVGVGTTSPDSRFTVKGDNALIDVQSTADGQTIGFLARYLNSSTLGGAFRYTTGDAQLYIDNFYEGNNGVYSDINIRNCDTGGNLINRIKIKGSSGNVGIGTTTPGYKLDINGNSRTTGIHYVDTYLVTPYIYGGGPITMGNNVFINSTEDGKLTLRVPSGDSSEWNYINFTGSNGVRDAYLGTDGGGTPTWYRDDNGVNITLGSSVLINGNTAWHAGNLTNLNQLTNGPGYITGYTETDTLASVTGRGASTSTPITVTGTEGREVAVYIPSSYTTDDLVSGHEYGWYSDHWRLGMTRSGGAAGADFVVQWNASRRLSLTSSGNLTATGTITATGGNSSNWNTAYSWGNHASASYATTSYVTTQINNLINGAPGVLDTLDELAAALGDDANFATTVTNSIAGKVSKAGDTITTSNNYGLVIDHTPVLGDFVDALLLRSTTSGQRAQMGFATVDSDGNHHRASIRAYKGPGTLEGAFGIALRQAGSGAHIQRFTLDYLGNVTIGGFLTESSSLKLKENVKTSEGNLEKVVNLRPVTYNKIGSQTTELGLIAEEVAEVYPEFVQYDENGEPIGVNYSRLTAALIGAVKELTNQVQELNKKING